MTDREKIEKLNIETKAELLTGGSFWKTRACAELDLPSVHLSDGPHGLRMQKKRPNHLGISGSLPATCYPTASAAACSFDEELCEEAGRRIGEEAAAMGVAMVLGPGLNIKRSPLCGRNFEYFSEDAYLSGKLAAAYVRGIQRCGVTACIKHFAVNGREYARMYCDSRVDGQTLHETYLTGFEIAVKEGGAGAVMSAYNKVNGVHCNQNGYLLNGVLRQSWGFNGLVVSDWGGSRGRVAALEAGADLEMPRCKISCREVVSAVKDGKLDEGKVNDSVERIVNFVRRSAAIEKKPYDRREHDLFAMRLAEESIVLLKNEDAALPLKAGEKVALIGDFAKLPRYQGAGSSQVNPVSLSNMLGAIKQSGLDFIGFERGFKRSGGKSKKLLNRAVKLARRAQTLVLCLGLDEAKESEGCDRSDLSINKNQIELLNSLASLGKKIVVVLSCGSAVLTDWDVSAQALVLAHLGGQAGAKAVLNVLTGKVNPSGRLAESYPLNEGSEPCADIYGQSPYKCDCAEGIYVGYKYYNALKRPVKYPFGFGLSYTSFLYSDFAVSRKGVRFKIKNTGAVGGADVAQVYIKAPRKNLEVSPSELKLFSKIYLDAGGEREVFLPFNGYSFRMWNPLSHRFEAGGTYKVSLCADSTRALFSGEVEITQDNLPEGCSFAGFSGEAQDYNSYYNSHITAEEKGYVPYKGMQATLETQVADLSYCRGITAKLFGLIAKISKRSKNKLKSSLLDWLPLRSFLQFLEFDGVQTEGFLLACNGHFFKGMWKIITKK